MGLLSTSAITNKVLNSGTAQKAQAIAGKVLPKTTATLAATENSVVNGVTSEASKLLSSATGTIKSAVTSIESGASNLLGSAEKTVGGYITSAEDAIGSEAASFTSLFSQSAQSVSKQINGLFSGVFSDTATQKSTTVPTVISDPVKSLMSESNPATTGYKLTTGSGKPVQVSVTGTTKLADGTSDLTSTQTQVLRNRFNLDDLTNLPSALTKLSNATGVSAVYSNLFGNSDGTSILQTAVKKVSGLEQEVVQGASSFLDGITGDVIGEFLPDTSVSSNSFSSVDNPQDIITTRDNQVTQDYIQKLTGGAKSLGCDSIPTYTSINVQTTLSGLLLNAASQSGLTDLVQKMLDCSSFFGAKNDGTLSKIVTSLGGSSPSTSNILISSMTMPTTLNQKAYTQSVVTDPNLTAADMPDLDGIFTKIKASPKATFISDNSSATGNLPTYDLSLAAKTQTDVLDGIFGKSNAGRSVLSDFLSSTITPVSSNGELSF